MRRAPRSLGVGIGAFLVLAGCNAKLPDPDSPGAKLYAERCDSCHRIYAPGTLKFEMWKYQVERMQGEIVRHGMPALTPSETQIILDYLQQHSG